MSYAQFDDNTKKYYRDYDCTILHRRDGPAIENADGTKLYCLNGVQLTYEEWRYDHTKYISEDKMGYFALPKGELGEETPEQLVEAVKKNIRLWEQSKDSVHCLLLARNMLEQAAERIGSKVPD